MTRLDIFNAMAARGAGQLILVSNIGPFKFPAHLDLQNVTLPALFFSKIVPSFNSSNLASLGKFVRLTFHSFLTNSTRRSVDPGFVHLPGARILDLDHCKDAFLGSTSIPVRDCCGRHLGERW